MALQVIGLVTAMILFPLALFDHTVVAQDRSMVGTWTWAFAPSGEPRENGTVTFKADGTMTWSGGSHGRWELFGRTVTLRWLDKDSIDTMTLSNDATTLEGRNKDGWRVRGTRPSIAGTWTWAFAPSGEPRENGTVTFKPDGTMTWSGGSQGTWERSGRTVTLRWLDKDSVDTMTVSGDERTLEGTNRDGWRVRGTRQIPRADSVVGTWTWAFSESAGGDVRTRGSVTFNSDGTVEWTGGSKGTWKQEGRIVTLTWQDKDSVDTMTLQDDAKKMVGRNAKNWKVEGTKR